MQNNENIVENVNNEANTNDDEYILVVKNLKQYFPIEKNFFGKPTRYLKAVDGVSFSIKKGHTFGLVGESGCGKTTLGRTLISIYNATDGEAFFEGQNILAYNKSEKRKMESLEEAKVREELLNEFKESNPDAKEDVIEAKRKEINSTWHVKRCENFLTTKEKRALKTKVQMIFQDPYSSLSPRMCVGEIISEAVKEHKLVSKEELKDYTFKIMKECGLQPYYYQRYPHEFSGGQRQRIGIARSLALNPKLVICDEPVSALDVSIQAQIINLLRDLQKEKGLSYLFISHDLSVVEHISDDVGVMYLGNLVEKGTKEQIFNNPSHPYTLALLSAIPQPDPDYKSERIKLKGELPSPANPPKGCKFHTRCDNCMKVCEMYEPKEVEIEPEHMVKCHLFDDVMLKLNDAMMKEEEEKSTVNNTVIEKEETTNEEIKEVISNDEVVEEVNEDNKNDDINESSNEENIVKEDNEE